jgi:ATP-dependent DNA ligase
MLRACAVTITQSAMLTLINPVELAEPFDHADWVFEAKFDGFRAAADTVRGRLISRNGNRMQRFEGVLMIFRGNGWRRPYA